MQISRGAFIAVKCSREYAVVCDSDCLGPPLTPGGGRSDPSSTLFGNLVQVTTWSLRAKNLFAGRPTRKTDAIY